MDDETTTELLGYASDKLAGARDPVLTFRRLVFARTLSTRAGGDRNIPKPTLG